MDIVTEEPDLVVLREALRQGERILTFQDEVRESILRRASDLLKLSVATLGGVIVITGILSATGVPMTPVAFGGFAVAVLCQVFSAGVLAALLSGGRVVGAFMFGPDLRRVVNRLRQGKTTEVGFLLTLIGAQPAWVEDNNRLMVRLQRMNASAVIALAVGTFILPMTLVYILGGAIFD